MYKTWNDLRKAMPQKLPWPIKELIIGNIITGNFTVNEGVTIAAIIGKEIKQ